MNSKQYDLFFEWAYPGIVELALDVLRVAPLSKLSIAVTKFVQELSTNRSNRIQFGSSSANGVLIFRSVASIVICASEKMKCTGIFRLKLLAVLLSSARGCLTGQYINFGIMRFYGDDSFDRVIQTCATMIQETSLQELIVSFPWHEESLTCLDAPETCTGIVFIYGSSVWRIHRYASYIRYKIHRYRSDSVRGGHKAFGYTSD